MSAPIIEGLCDPRFQRVQDALAESFTRFGETGASLALTLDNRPVVDLQAGHVDTARTKPWKPDTIANVYSTTKGMTAICALRLVDQGRLDLDAPVAKYWPEFAQAGKETLKVRWLLSHRAGLPAVAKPLAPEAMYEWETMTTALAEQKPWWEPGTKHGYHAVTYGWLVGEVVRRITGKSLGTYFRDEVAGPLGADFHIGLGPEHDARVADLIPPPPPTPDQTDLLSLIMNEPESMLAKTFTNPLVQIHEVNSRAWRGAEIPAANGHTNAHALARVYGALACGGVAAGVRVLSPAVIELGYTEQSDGMDEVLPLHTRIGLGFFLSTPTEKLGPNPRSFGHGGMGGSLGFADPDTGLGFGYVMNEMHSGLWLIDPRPAALIEAVYECL
jgi:CubicO group peptidase (beta-lactamase class C family)